MTLNITKPCCSKAPVYSLINEKLCKSHFADYFEGKVLRTIRQFELLGKKENLGIALSGGKDSLTVLKILSKISKENPNIKLNAILIDEGISGYRDKTIETAKKFCKEHKVKLHIFSYRKEFGMTLDEILKKLKVKPCTVCGIFRRYLLNKKSRELGFTKLATGHNLDDESQSIMMNQMKNSMPASARLGPKSGIFEDEGFIPRIKPLYLCSEKEVTTYAFLNNLLDSFIECPNAKVSYRAQIRDMLNDMEQKSPGTKHGIVNSFLEVLPELRKKYSGQEKMPHCKKCKEPSAKEMCNACIYVEKLEALK
jgi:tRNA-5-methyluridine54 2-sulfurtransferase